MRPASLIPPWACLALVACAPASFTTELKGETTVPAGPPGTTAVLNAFPPIASFAGLDFDQNQDFKNQGISKSDVKSVHPKSLELRLLSPSDEDFTFLDTLEFYAKAGDKEERIAHKQDISQLRLSAPNPVLKMDMDDVELQPFVAAPSMSIIVRGKGRMPDKEVRLQAVLALDVKVSLY